LDVEIDHLAKKSICNFNRMLIVLDDGNFPESSVGTPRATKDSSSHEDNIFGDFGDFLNSLDQVACSSPTVGSANLPILLDSLGSLGPWTPWAQ
jgi:hypothetical protein